MKTVFRVTHIEYHPYCYYSIIKRRLMNFSKKNGGVLSMKRYLFRSKGWFYAYLITLLFNQALIISVALYLKYVVDAAAAMDKEKLIMSIYRVCTSYV